MHYTAIDIPDSFQYINYPCAMCNFSRPEKHVSHGINIITASSLSPSSSSSSSSSLTGRENYARTCISERRNGGHFGILVIWNVSSYTLLLHQKDKQFYTVEYITRNRRNVINESSYH